MKIYEYRPGMRPKEAGCVLALGFFDGVHIAHRELIARAASEAKARSAPLGIFTFRAEDSLKGGAPRIYGTRDKLEIFDTLGVDFTVVADFAALSGMSGEEFVKKVLIEDLSAELCVAGFNFRFGKGAASDAIELANLMKRAGREALILEELTSGDVTVSATLIRKLLASADIEKANKLLGSPYFISGKVDRGLSVGRTLGFPTVNTDIPKGQAIPRLGVYRTAVPIGDKIYAGVTNIGKCPTFGERRVHAETHLVDFSGDLYGEDFRIYFIDFLRDEIKFNSKEELILQIKVDKNNVINKNGAITWQELGLK